MTRWKASAVHLSISAAIAVCAAILIFGVWYPPPFTHAAGADQLILVLLCVDVVLGPLLTLIVYRHGKWGMRFDLVAIALLQLSAFTYGMSVIVSSRPVFVVGAIDRFVLVTPADLSPADLAKGSKPEFRTLSWSGPRVVNALRPESSSERSDLLFSGAAGKDIEQFPKYYVDYPEQGAKLLERARALDLLPKKAGYASEVDAWLQKNKRERADVLWIPLVGRGHDTVLLLEKNGGAILDSLPLDPWP